MIVDDLSRREVDLEIGAQSLVPIYSVQRRIMAWKQASGRTIQFRNLNLAEQTARVHEVIADFRPDGIVHLAAQRSAPYSMAGSARAALTLSNNILAAQNLLQAVSKIDRAIRIVHLGSIGVYGYRDNAGTIPEGEVAFQYQDGSARRRVASRFPARPSSIYHTSKAQIALLLDYYAQYHGLDITDLYQGIVWGTQTEDTMVDPVLSNRFDYDQYYGTVLNRFIVQAAAGQPLSVYGRGRQTRAFIHIADTVRCIAHALGQAPNTEGRVRVFHQVAETKTVRAVAEAVALRTGAPIATVPNPRREDEDHPFDLELRAFKALGLNLRTLDHDLLAEISETAAKFRDRIDVACMTPSVIWDHAQPKAMKVAG